MIRIERVFYEVSLDRCFAKLIFTLSKFGILAQNQPQKAREQGYMSIYYMPDMGPARWF